MLRAQRLRNHQLLAGRARTGKEVVAALGAVQAQDYASGLWAIGCRYPGATRTEVEQAIRDREIVRSWPMRGTLHFVLATDLRWMLALLAPRMINRARPRLRQLDLSEADIERSANVIEAHLHDAAPATRDELFAVLDRNGIASAGQRGIHVLLRLCQEGRLCQGPYRDRQPTFTLLDEWLPAVDRLSDDEAIARLARRYFTGHGPATVADFAWWAGCPLGIARTGVEAVAEELAHVVVGERTYIYSANEPDSAISSAAPGRAALLLPGFDEYLLGYRDRSLVLADEHAERVVPGGNGIFQPTVVVGGRIVGTWRRPIVRGTVALSVETFAPVPESANRSIETAAKRYARFVGAPFEVTIV
jgi:hypothetical protein